MAQNDKANTKSKGGKNNSVDSDESYIIIDLEDLKDRKRALVEKEIEKIEDGLTTKELSKLWCVAQRTAQRRIKQMIGDGEAFMNGRSEHVKADGTKGHSPLYILKK